MNLDRPIFGRLTIGSTRTSLGRANLATMFVRAAQTLKSSRVNDSVIVLEMSVTRLPDSTALDSIQVIEQEIAAQTVADPDTESPFPGITVGRVQEAMDSDEYKIWEYYCQPENRLALTPGIINHAREHYEEAFPDCAPHFPKYVDS